MSVDPKPRDVDLLKQIATGSKVSEKDWPAVQMLIDLGLAHNLSSRWAGEQRGAVSSYAGDLILSLSTQLAERDREFERALAEAAIERSVGQQQLEALDGALRIALWNECRGKGMSQDDSLLHIRDRMSTFLASKEQG